MPPAAETTKEVWKQAYYIERKALREAQAEIATLKEQLAAVTQQANELWWGT